MADGDAPSIHVEAVIGQAQRVAAVEDLACKGLVQFPKADVADAEAEAIEEFGNGEHGPYPHFIGLSACNGHSEIASKRLQRSEEHTSELQSLMRNSYAVSRL